MKKHPKAKKIGRAVLIGTAVLLIGLPIFHRCKLAADRKFLREQGCYDLVSAGDHALNVVRLGNQNAPHRIIALSGMGGGFSVQMRKMTAGLESEYAVVYVARAGWDGSEDVKTERTAENIVMDYREALRNAGIPAPYILMAHSMGSTYASYWVSQYPDEIEAFVSIDGTYVEPFDDLPEPDAGNHLLTKAAVHFGIGDILTALSPKDPFYSSAEQRAYNALNLMCYASDAVYNEAAYIDKNRNDTWQALIPNDVPKLYIAARDGYRQPEDITGMDDRDIEYYTPGFSGTDAERREAAYTAMLAECAENRTNELLPYLEKMGNCRLEYLPGDHFIHQTEPEKCGTLIREFLSGLNG